MLTKEAIQELSNTHAIGAASMAIDRGERAVIGLPGHIQLHDLEKYLPNRRRARGTMTTSSLEAFGAYVTSHAESGASVFVNQDTMSADAVLNMGSPAEPGHADNIAKLAPKKTAAYLALLAVANGQAKAQAEVAEFIEDWMPNIQCFPPADPETEAPPPAMQAKHAAAAIRRITIEAMQKMDNSEGQLSATRSALESVKANSNGNPLPAFVHFRCEPFMGFASRVFQCRVSVLTGEKAPKLVLRIAQAEQHSEEMAAELAGLVAGEIGDAMPCLLGQYKPGA